MGSILPGIAVLLALALVLLAVPVMVAFRIVRVEEVRGEMNFRWLFGLVRFRVAVPASAGPERGRQRKAPGKARERGKGKKVRGILNLLRQSAFRRRSAEFLGDILRATHARDLYLRLRVGLGDPADTGRLWALLGPAAGVAATLRGVEVRIEPDFTEPLLEVESRGEFRLVPLQFIALAIAFAASPATLRALREWRQGSA